LRGANTERVPDGHNAIFDPETISNSLGCDLTGKIPPEIDSAIEAAQKPMK